MSLRRTNFFAAVAGAMMLADIAVLALSLQHPRSVVLRTDSGHRYMITSDRRDIALVGIDVNANGIVASGAYWNTYCSAAHSLLLALPAAVLIMCVIAHRRRAKRDERISRGQCTSCGYPLTGNRSGRCPECGADLWEGTVKPGTEKGRDGKGVTTD